KVHTRRVRLLWRRLASGQGQAIVRASSGDPFDPGNWWRNTRDAFDVVREVLGVLNAWSSPSFSAIILHLEKGRISEKEKSLAAGRQYIFYFGNMRQRPPLESREGIIVEQCTCYLFAKLIHDDVVRRLQTKRTRPRVVR